MLRFLWEHLRPVLWRTRTAFRHKLCQEWLLGLRLHIYITVNLWGSIFNIKVAISLNSIHARRVPLSSPPKQLKSHQRRARYFYSCRCRSVGNQTRLLSFYLYNGHWENNRDLYKYRTSHSSSYWYFYMHKYDQVWQWEKEWEKAVGKICQTVKIDQIQSRRKLKCIIQMQKHLIYSLVSTFVFWVLVMKCSTTGRGVKLML